MKFVAIERIGGPAGGELVHGRSGSSFDEGEAGVDNRVSEFFSGGVGFEVLNLSADTDFDGGEGGTFGSVIGSA